MSRKQVYVYSSHGRKILIEIVGIVHNNSIFNALAVRYTITPEKKQIQQYIVDEVVIQML